MWEAEGEGTEHLQILEKEYEILNLFLSPVFQGKIWPSFYFQNLG